MLIFYSGYITVATLLAILSATVILFFRHKYGYWSRRGVPCLSTRFPFGHIKDAGRVEHISQIIHHHYRILKCTASGLAGMYFFTQPVLVLLDMDLIKTVLMKDFNSFSDRGLYYNDADDPLSAHLVALDGAHWKPLRAKVTPTFTLGKMKFMYPTIVEVAQRLHKHLADQMTAVEENEGVVFEMRDIFARYTTDVIGTCAFGIECNSIQDPNGQFRMVGKKVFAHPRYRGIAAFLMLTFRETARRLHYKVFHDDVAEFFLGIVNETVAYREKNAVRRNDFMDLLIQLKNEPPKDGVAALTMDELAAQAFVFFLAGFETTSSALSYALYELSLNGAIQERARKEIKTVLTRHNGQLTYEAMMEMTYIEQILYESLRKYPPIAGLTRRNTVEYTFPNSNVTIDRDTFIIVPVYAIHHDAEFYPDPEKFDPERFTAEAVKARPHETFLPFGTGPRNCIGLRFGMMKARIGLITVLQHFTIEACAELAMPLKFYPATTMLTPTTGLNLRLRQIC